MDFSFKMMDFVLKLMDFIFKMMNCVFKMMKFVLQMMDCVLKMMDCVFKMMNFGRGRASAPSEVEARCWALPLSRYKCRWRGGATVTTNSPIYHISMIYIYSYIPPQLRLISGGFSDQDCLCLQSRWPWPRTGASTLSLFDWKLTVFRLKMLNL